MKRLRFLGLLGSWIGGGAVCRAVEKRSPPAPVEGVPEIYWGLYRGGFTDDETADFLARMPYESISLQRTPCYGPCPVYTVTFSKSGQAECKAERNLSQTGELVGRIDAESYGRLCYALDQLRFTAFRDRYEPELRWTDDASCIVTARRLGQPDKAVFAYGGVGPIELWTIQQVLDRLREQIPWKPK